MAEVSSFERTGIKISLPSRKGSEYKPMIYLNTFHLQSGEVGYSLRFWKYDRESKGSVAWDSPPYNKNQLQELCKAILKGLTDEDKK